MTRPPVGPETRFTIPDEDWSTLFRWATGLRPDGVVLDHSPLPRHWLRLDALTTQFDQHEKQHEMSTRAMWGGVAHCGQHVVLRIEGTTEGLRYQLGAADGDNLHLLTAMSAAFPGAAVSNQAHTAVELPATADLSGLVDVGQVRAGDLMDRLGFLRTSPWSLTVDIWPASPAFIEERLERTVEIAGDVAVYAVAQGAVNDTVSRTVTDPGADSLLRSLRAMEDRLQTMLVEGGFLVSVRVAASSDRELRAVAAIVAGQTGMRRADKSEGRPVGVWTIEELGLLAAPPSTDRAGLAVRRLPQMNQSTPVEMQVGESIDLGVTVGHHPLRLPLEQLTSHMMVTGQTGSGKTTTILAIVEALQRHRIPVTIFEPVKLEYATWAQGRIPVWRAGSTHDELQLTLNPLQLPPNEDVQTYIERLGALLAASLGLVEPLDHIVHRGLQSVYEEFGVDATSGRRPPNGRWPTVSDLLNSSVSFLRQLGYDSTIRGNLEAALTARLGVLTCGSRAHTFDRDVEFPDEMVFGQSIVINLDAVGDPGARSFLMGILLLRLRAARRQPSNRLLHVTILEEAHLLSSQHSRISRVDQGNRSNVAAEMIGDLFCEIRAYGEGLVIVDQRASALLDEAVANTATKVALRADHRDDQHALGAALGLDSGTEGLGALDRHEALVKLAGMPLPVLARLAHRYSSETGSAEPVPHRTDRTLTPCDELQGAVTALALCDSSDDTRREIAFGAACDVIARRHPQVPPSERPEVVRSLLEGWIRLRGRRRGWDRVFEDALVSAAHDLRDAPSVRSALLDGRHRVRSCSLVCPEGGCVLGEVVGHAMQRLGSRSGGSVSWLTDIDSLAVAARHAADTVVGTGDAELGRLARQCVIANCFDDTLPIPELRGLLDAVESRCRAAV